MTWPIDLIVFDFDGTICDSAGIKDEAYRLLYLDEMGPEFAARVQRYHLENAGVSRFDKIVHVEETMVGRPCTETRLNEVAGRFSAIVEDQVVAAAPIAGSLEFLDAAAGRVTCTVASATPTDELRRIVDRRDLTGRFAAVEGSPDSKAEIIERHLDRFGVARQRALMVGDQRSDYAAAELAAVGFVGVGPNAPDDTNTLAILPDLIDLDRVIGRLPS